MYVGSYEENDYKKIDAFLMAYEMGSMRQCEFRNRLIRQIEDKHGVKIPSEGLAMQLSIASKQANQEIQEFFIAESMEILIAESDQNNKNRFINYNRKELIKQLTQFSETISSIWVLIFSQAIREIKAWKGANLTNEEISDSERLIDEINHLIKNNVMESVVVPESIKVLKDKLLEKLNKQLMG